MKAKLIGTSVLANRSTLTTRTIVIFTDARIALQ
jgi:hypothetical protein